MRAPKGQPALWSDFNIPSGVEEIKGREGDTYLQFSSHMVTFYKQTYGEHSRFFLGLRDAKLIGAKCDKCKQVMVPAATWHCPNCNFAEMHEVELPHEGVLAFTAPITIFPSAAFTGDAPFARGYIDVATDAPIASYLPSRLRTTTGLERPGIFVKGTKLKLVFQDEREGQALDIFWVPMSELNEAQRKKAPLFASDLNFTTPVAPEVKVDDAKKQAKNEALKAIATMAAGLEKSPRGQADIAGRKHAVGVKTGGGDFGLYVEDSKIRAEDGIPANAEYTMVADDPAIFTRWVHDGSLTDAAVEGSLWLPHKQAFQLLPILDRLPRSIRRDLKK